MINSPKDVKPFNRIIARHGELADESCLPCHEVVEIAQAYAIAMIESRDMILSIPYRNEMAKKKRQWQEIFSQWEKEK